MKRNLLFVMLLALLQLGASCGETVVKLMPGVLNNPGNRSLRRAIFGFATSRLCSEMQGRSVPLKLNDADPTIGRFYPRACSVRELGNENLFVQFLGHGYAWTNVTGRMGFEASAAVEYEHDFLVQGDTMYVYFRQKQTQAAQFRTLMVERGGTPGVASVAGMLGADVKAASQQVGERLLQHHLARGFTVVREDDGTVSFALGVLDKGATVPVPFARGDSDWTLLANERTELHGGQRDYLGPFTIKKAGEALVLTALLEGAPAIDVLVVSKSAGEQWLSQYEHYAATGGPSEPATWEDTVTAQPAATGAPPLPYRRQLPLPPGEYYLVLDNSASAGKTAPAGGPADDRAALVSYAVQLGEP